MITWTKLLSEQYYRKAGHDWWLINHISHKKWRLFRNECGYIGVFPTLRAAKIVAQTIIDAEKGKI